MDWILQHLQLILVIAGSIAMWLNNRQREKQGLPADFDEDGVPENNRSPVRAEVRELAPLSRDGSDPEQEDRVRRIQEEIRRKIAERRGQGPASAQPPTLPPQTIGERMADPFRPIFQETPPSLLKPAARPEPAPVPVEVAGYADEAALERQRALSEQLRQLEERRREALQTASTASRGASAVVGLESLRGASPVAPRVGAGSLPDEFRDPRALRTAMVWREVLGAPVGLR